jgi:hypothetical protein
LSLLKNSQMALSLGVFSLYGVTGSPSSRMVDEPGLGGAENNNLICT